MAIRKAVRGVASDCMSYSQWDTFKQSWGPLVNITYYSFAAWAQEIVEEPITTHKAPDAPQPFEAGETVYHRYQGKVVIVPSDTLSRLPRTKYDYEVQYGIGTVYVYASDLSRIPWPATETAITTPSADDLRAQLEAVTRERDALASVVYAACSIQPEFWEITLRGGDVTPHHLNHRAESFEKLREAFEALPVEVAKFLSHYHNERIQRPI